MKRFLVLVLLALMLVLGGCKEDLDMSEPTQTRAFVSGVFGTNFSIQDAKICGYQMHKHGG